MNGVKMAANEPCSVRSWTPERQYSCRYHCHVKLFYEVDDRSVWSLASQVILKARSNSPQILKQNTSNIRYTEKDFYPNAKAWQEDNGRDFMLTERSCGEYLNVVWPTLSTVDRERIARQTAEYLLELRELHSPQMQMVAGV